MSATIYEANYRRLRKILGSELDSLSESIKCTSEGFMPLTFDIIDRSEKAVQYAMADWYEQNGDLIQDPEMIIEIKGTTVEAISIQHALPFNRVIRVYNEDRTQYSPKEKRDQNQFLKMWLRNIHDQGFKLDSADY